MTTPPIIRPTIRKSCLTWLESYHVTVQLAWVIFSKKKNGLRDMSWSEAMDEVAELSGKGQRRISRGDC